MTIQDLIKNVSVNDLTPFARAVPSQADHLLSKAGGIIPTLEQDEVKWRVKDNGRYVHVAKYRAFDASVPFATREAWQTTRQVMLPPARSCSSASRSRSSWKRRAARTRTG